MKPSLATRTRLWVLRSPIRFAAMVVVVVCLIGLAGYLRYGEIRSAQQKLDAESKALAEANKTIEDLKEEMRGHVLWMLTVFTSRTPDEPRTILWLREIFGQTTINLDGPMSMPSEAVDLLQDNWKRIQASDRRIEVESLLAGMALCHVLLEQREIGDADRVLSELEEEWSDRLDPMDRLFVSLESIRGCVDALRSIESGASPADQIFRIREIESRLKAAGVLGPLPPLIRSIRVELSDRFQG